MAQPPSMDILQQLGAFFTAHQSQFFVFARVCAVIAIACSCFAASGLIIGLPIRIRFGIVRLDGLLKFVVVLATLAWMVAALWVVTWFDFIVIAKLCLINVMIVGSIVCWVLLLSGPQLHAMLGAVQQECELATNLTFLQAEMTRAQLEELNARIQKSIQPEERELTEAMFKTISPLVSLFFKKEKSVLKWSVAAVDVVKQMMQYFWSDKK